MPESKTPWPHAPTHQLSTAGTYFVTASSYLKAHHFRGAERLRVLHRGLLTVTRDYRWQLEAWAVFSNHYHFVAHSPADEPDAESLGPMLKTLHVKTSGWVNTKSPLALSLRTHGTRSTFLNLARTRYFSRKAPEGRRSPKPGGVRERLAQDESCVRCPTDY